MATEPDGRLSLHRQIASKLRDQIKSGELPPNAVLPSASQIVRQYAVSRYAADRVLKTLRQEGLIDTRPGKFPRVRAPEERQPITLDDGDEVIARLPTDAERRDLWLRLGVPIVEIRRAGGDIEIRPANTVSLRGPSG